MVRVKIIDSNYQELILFSNDWNEIVAFVKINKRKAKGIEIQKGSFTGKGERNDKY